MLRNDRKFKYYNNLLLLVDILFLSIFTRSQVWSSGIVVACICLCVCVRECRPQACLHHNSSLIQAKITKFWPEVQKKLGQDPHCFGGRLTFTFKVKFNLKKVQISLCPVSPPESIHNSHDYLYSFMVPTVSQSPFSASTSILLHGPKYFTVPTLCMYTDLVSWGYFGIEHCSCS